MRKPTESKPTQTVVEPGALIASGISVKIAEHDGKKCANCSEFHLHFIAGTGDTFLIKMQGAEFKAFYESIGTCLERMAKAMGEEGK